MLRRLPPARLDRRAFTLLEVLLVLVILGLIAAVVVPNLMGVHERALVNTTKSSIVGLEESIKLYVTEHAASYPQSLDELFRPVDLDGQPMKPYLTEAPKDAWNQPLNYELDDADANGPTARIWSNGPNRRNENGGGDDIANWTDRASA